MFMFELGRGALAIIVFGGTTLACGSEEGPVRGVESSEGGDSSDSPSAVRPSESTTNEGPISWGRVDLGFVSAYILSRAGEAAVVDTGVRGSAPQIGDALDVAGLSWSAVGHVILTHLHDDHIGSLDVVVTQAPDAIVYAGEGDLAQIPSPKRLVAVADGDQVFGLQIIDTPGHTAGHISVLDPVGGVLVAGDALTGLRGGGVGGPTPQFTADLGVAFESVKKLATFEFETALFGHGEPVESGASAAVAELAATL
jgi:glyoxylase-like metal-dependent hydrolase (beta-lactamase superfamily II)